MAPNRERIDIYEPLLPHIEHFIPRDPTPKTTIVWRNVYLFAFLHIGAFYGLYLALTSAMNESIIFSYAIHVFSGLGVTAGAHRLWAHRSYKAKTSLRIFLMFFNCMAVQNDIIEWARDHRVHHKFSETNADPHNVTRGFFFAHIGWLLCKKHPEVKEKGMTVAIDDLTDDPTLTFQRRYYLPLVFIFAFMLPICIPYYCWSESFSNCLFVCAFMRYCWTLNASWLVNSAAHLWGQGPYDKTNNSKDNVIVSIASIGEGWHNYHHTFPTDYKTAELPYVFNVTTAFIDLCACFGLAYDLKSVPTDVIKQRRMRTGDRFEQ